MSSNSYSICLDPDPWLRILVLTSGRLLIAVGLILILTLDIHAAVRGVGCCGWMLLGHREIVLIERGFAFCTALRFSSNGEIAVRSSEHDWWPCELQTGSLLLRNFACLRLRTEQGEILLELLRGSARQSHEWRRLQVIWRHIGADG